jgi:thiamine pyrophosphate-dependent acetolactate synthase large subunit-like protein
MVGHQALGARGASPVKVHAALAAVVGRRGQPVVFGVLDDSNMTTLPAKGLFAASQYDLGVCGTYSTPAGIAALQEADCILVLGTSVNPLTAGGEGCPYFSETRLVRCNIDPGAAPAVGPGSIQLIGDVTVVVEELSAMLREIGHTPSTFRERHRVATHAIDRVHVPGGRSWCCSFIGFGAVGNAVSTAIGMASANPGVPSMAIAGDGLRRGGVHPGEPRSERHRRGGPGRGWLDRRCAQHSAFDRAAPRPVSDRLSRQ